MCTLQAEDEIHTHNIINCGNCHSLLADVENMSDRASIQNNVCRSCHEEPEKNTKHTDNTFHNSLDLQCSSCHSYHNTDIIKTGKISFSINLRDKGSTKICKTCHNNIGILDSLSAGHKAAGQYFHVDYGGKYANMPSESCLICHSISENVQSQNIDDIPLFNVDASHPYNIIVKSGNDFSGMIVKREIDKDILLFNENMECQTCHIFGGKSSFSIVNLKKSGNICLGCHEKLKLYTLLDN